MSNSDIQVIEISLHRNGGGGEPFHAIRWSWRPPDALGRREEFYAAVFRAPRHLAVISLDRVPSMGVGYARGNSWSAENFEPFLRALIEEHRKGTVKEGGGLTVPFTAVPKDD